MNSLKSLYILLMLDGASSLTWVHHSIDSTEILYLKHGINSYLVTLVYDSLQPS